MRLVDIIPDSESVLELLPEELAGYLLEYIHVMGRDVIEQRLNTQVFGQVQTFDGYATDQKEAVQFAWMEAWTWLLNNGFLAPRPGQMNRNWLFLTRRGQNTRNHQDLEAFQRASCLPRQLLHRRIADVAWAQFLRGEYDTAVFNAFKEVEIAVRVATGLDQTDYGTDLMRKAFHVDNGPLTDLSAPKAEREALSNLFAGAIGSYKNPHSHRRVAITAEEAAEMVVLASHLIEIVEVRSNT